MYEWRQKLQDFINFVIFLSGSGYAIHKIWKKYICKLLFGEKKKSLTASEETLAATQNIVSGINRLQSSMENLATTVSTHVGSIQDMVKAQIDEKRGVGADDGNNVEGVVGSLNLLSTDLRKEIQSIKGLLLSPSRFPENPTITPVSLPQETLTGKS